MLRLACLFLLLPLAGCALNHGGPAWGSRATAAVFDFDWTLSGDAAVAPLQVFGTGRETWLQFEPGQPVPALFASTQQGERPLSYRRQEPYIIVDGEWSRLTLRGGSYVAHATRTGAVAHTPAAPAWTAPPAQGQASGTAVGSPHQRAASLEDTLENTPPPVPRVLSALSSADAATAVRQPGPDTSAAAAPGRLEPASVRYRASPPDKTLRSVLARWAESAGWTFQPQHWSVDVDIPLAGSADFDGDFRDAVRALLSSTELTERPVQPCFYTNRVLRVVPHAQACDRTMARGGVAS